MAGGKGKSAGGKSAGGKTSSADGPKKQQSHSARAGLQVSKNARLLCSGNGCITNFGTDFVFATRDKPPRNLDTRPRRTKSHARAQLAPLDPTQNLRRCTQQYLRTRLQLLGFVLSSLRACQQ